jgi:hypothetical protein
MRTEEKKRLTLASLFTTMYCRHWRESTLLFDDSYTVPGPIALQPLIPTSIAGSIALAVIYPEKGAIKPEDSDEIKGGGSEPQELCFASPLVGCNDELSSMSGYTLKSAFAFAVSVAVLSARSSSYCDVRRRVWRSSRHELSVYSSLKAGQLRNSESYRILWKNILLKEYFASTLSDAASFARGSGDTFARIPLSGSPLQGPGLKLFDHARAKNILEASVHEIARELSMLCLRFGVPCQCGKGKWYIIRESVATAFHISIPRREGRGRSATILKVDFGGVVHSVSTHEGQKGVGSSNLRSYPLPRHFHQSASAWESSRRAKRRGCNHACLVVRVVGAVHQQHSQAVLDFARDMASILKRSLSNIPQGIEECSLHFLCAGVTSARCLASICEVGNSASSSQLVLGSTSQEEGVQKVANEDISPATRSRHSLLVTACQVFHALRRINQPQWSVIYETLRCIISRVSKRFVPKIVAQGPPGTGKTTTIVKLLSLLYHDTPEYYDPSALQEQRLPSFRTLVRSASNAGIDQILSSLILDGVFALTLDSISGKEQPGSATYFENTIRQLNEQIEKGTVDYSSLFGTRALRSPQQKVQRIDEDYSDLKVLRVGATEHQEVGKFRMRNWRGFMSEADELEDTR